MLRSNVIPKTCCLLRLSYNQYGKISFKCSVYEKHNMGKGKTLPVAPGTPGLPWDPFGGLTQPAPKNKQTKKSHCMCSYAASPCLWSCS